MKYLSFFIALVVVLPNLVIAQNDIFGRHFNFTLKELQDDEVNIESIIDKSWSYNDSLFQKQITDKNVIWEKNKNEIKQEIDESYRNSELIFSKYQVLENQLKNQVNSKKFLKKSLKEKKELKTSYENQRNALEELLKSIINSKKIYGIFKTEFEIEFSQMKNTTTKVLHDFGEEIIKDFAEETFISSIYNETILEQNNLTSVIRNLIRNVETSNISIPYTILYKKNKSNTIKVITLVALTMSNQVYDVNDLYEESEFVKQLRKSTKKSRQTNIFYLKGENATSNHSFTYLRDQIATNNKKSAEELEDWFEEMKSIIDRSIEGNLSQKWEDEINEYLNLKNSFKDSENKINTEIADLEKQIEEAENLIVDYTNQICNNRYALRQLELERAKKIEKYKRITRKRIFYGKTNGSISTGDSKTPISALRELLLNQMNELQDKHVTEYSKTYISEINNVASQKKLQEIVSPEVMRICILDFAYTPATQGETGLVLTIYYGYELKLEIEEKHQKKFKPTSFYNRSIDSTIAGSDESQLFDTDNQLIWKRIKLRNDENTYGSSSEDIQEVIEKRAQEEWRLPTVEELLLLKQYIQKNKQLELRKHDIVLTDEIPYWTNESYDGPSFLKMRKVVYLKKTKGVDSRDVTDSGYFIWVKNIPAPKDEAVVDCNRKALD